MSWAKIDDHANEHPKLLAAGAEAAWVWVCGLMYANRQRARDGFIPEAVVPMLYPVSRPKRVANKLVSVGLWDRVEGGFSIHNFDDWNESAERVEDKRAKGRERAKRSYQRRKRGFGSTKDALNEPRGVPVSDQSSGEDTAKTGEESAPHLHDSSGSTPLHSTPSPPDGGDPPNPPTIEQARETPCPTGLVEQAIASGVVAELAAALRVPPEDVVAKCREFVSYWTVGGGTGQRRPMWMRRLREDVRKAHQSGSLKSSAAELTDEDRKLAREREATAIARAEAHVCACLKDGTDPHPKAVRKLGPERYQALAERYRRATA